MVISSLERVGERLETLERGANKGEAPPQGSLQVGNHDRGTGDPGEGGQQGGGPTTGQSAGRQP